MFHFGSRSCQTSGEFARAPELWRVQLHANIHSHLFAVHSSEPSAISLCWPEPPNKFQPECQTSGEFAMAAELWRVQLHGPATCQSEMVPPDQLRVFNFGCQAHHLDIFDHFPKLAKCLFFFTAKTLEYAIQ